MKLYTNDLLQSIFAQATLRPNAIALEEVTGRKLTYREVAERVNTAALSLAAHGFQRGDRVLIMIRPGLDVFLLALAIIRAGGVIVLADLAMGREAFASRMKLAAPRWIFAESLLLALQRLPFARRMLRARGVEIPDLGAISGAKIVASGRWLPLLPPHLSASRLMHSTNPGLKWDEVEIEPESDLLIVFTSGTTAAPKGIVHSHASLWASLQMILAKMPAQPRDTFYASVLHIIIPALCGGARAIIAPARFSASATLRDLMRFNVSQTFATPAEYEELISFCRANGQQLPPTLKAIMLGSAPVGPGFLQRLKQVLAPETAVWAVYGMTEMLPIAAVSLDEKIAFSGAGDLMGSPLPGVKVAIADDGELLVSGPNLFRRLLGGAPVSEYASGDLAQIDELGRLVLLGRKKDMIIRQGHNIYPGMIEATIQKIPGVLNCALVGRYDPDTSDEQIALVVEKDDPLDDTTYRQFLAAELLHGPYSIDLYAQPDQIIFSNLPRSGRNRKVDKNKLRAMLAEESRTV